MVVVCVVFVIPRKISLDVASLVRRSSLLWRPRELTEVVWSPTQDKFLPRSRQASWTDSSRMEVVLQPRCDGLSVRERVDPSLVVEIVSTVLSYAAALGATETAGRPVSIAARTPLSHTNA